MSMNEARALLFETESTEMVYVHDEEGNPIMMVIPVGGWWAQQLPKAPKEHFGHEHVYPWGGDE